MRIWIITVGEPLPGYSGRSRLWRSGFLCNVLAHRGHDVTWWTSSVDHFNKRHIVQNSLSVRTESGFTIRFLHGCLYRRNVGIRRLINHYQIASAFAAQAVKASRPHVIVCSFPTIELAYHASEFGARNAIPVILDVRDLWPDELVLRAPQVLRPLAKLLTFKMAKQANAALRTATSIIGISNTYLAWALARAGRTRTDRDRVIPLGYTSHPPQEIDPDSGDRLRLLGVDPDRRIFLFCGSFVGSIDLATVIEGARKLVGVGNIQFVFAGSGEKEAEWRSLARGLRNVVFTGWVEKSELDWLGQVAWAGIAAYKPDATQSLPNKLFEYASFGLPVVSSLSGEAKELISREQIGISYEAGNANDLAEKCSLLTTDLSRHRTLARNAKAIFNARFAPEIVYQEFADYIEAQINTEA